MGELTFEAVNGTEKEAINKVVKSTLSILESNFLLSLSTFDDKSKQPFSKPAIHPPKNVVY